MAPAGGGEPPGRTDDPAWCIFASQTRVGVALLRGGDDARRDPLTGLADRVAFEAALAHAVDAAWRADGRRGARYADLNEFKRVNDCLGHDIGDELLGSPRPPAQRGGRRSPGRAATSSSSPVLARRPARPSRETQAQRIADAMLAPFALGAAELLVDASVGVSLFPADAETAETLRKHADAAMYEAKAAGGGVARLPRRHRRPDRAASTLGRPLRRAIERERARAPPPADLRLPTLP